MVASINNGETGLSAREKLNDIITNNNSIEDLPAGSIPMAGGTSLTESSVQEMSDMIMSTKSLKTTASEDTPIVVAPDNIRGKLLVDNLGVVVTTPIT